MLYWLLPWTTTWNFGGRKNNRSLLWLKELFHSFFYFHFCQGCYGLGSVCLSVSRIMEKILAWFSWNLAGGCSVGQRKKPTQFWREFEWQGSYTNYVSLSVILQERSVVTHRCLQQNELNLLCMHKPVLLKGTVCHDWSNKTVNIAVETTAAGM